jgi:hypothetical protein
MGKVYHDYTIDGICGILKSNKNIQTQNKNILFMADFVAFSTPVPEKYNPYKVLLRGIQRPFDHIANCSLVSYVAPASQKIISLVEQMKPVNFEHHFCKTVAGSKEQLHSATAGIAARMILAGDSVEYLKRKIPLGWSSNRFINVYLEGFCDMNGLSLFARQDTAIENDADLIALTVMKFMEKFNCTFQEAFRKTLAVVNGEYVAVALYAYEPEMLLVGNRNREFYFGVSDKRDYLVASNTPILLEHANRPRKIYRDKILHCSNSRAGYEIISVLK